MGNQPYPSIPNTMVQQGLINADSYGLYLNDVRSPTGSIVFGGVDIAKYSGNLKTFNSTDAQTITMTGLNMVTPSGNMTLASQDTFTANASLQFGTS